MVRRPTCLTLLLKRTTGRQGRTRAVVIAAALGLVLAAGIVAAFKVFHDMEESVRDSYAAWWVAGMVNVYMEKNDGNWPSGWEDMKEPYELCVARSGRPWTFEYLQSRVDIDFSANPNELAKMSLKDGKAPFRVVYLRNGKTHHWEGAEPNLLIWQHLQKRAQSRGS